ncbi:MAG TPA: hypothetical protein VNV88_10490, partial [Candidatus Solibacter sp.]|nr:hypothetical protein [Candidatus Solibacter sp.]
ANTATRLTPGLISKSPSSLIDPLNRHLRSINNIVSGGSLHSAFGVASKSMSLGGIFIPGLKRAAEKIVLLLI